MLEATVARYYLIKSLATHRYCVGKADLDGWYSGGGGHDQFAHFST